MFPFFLVAAFYTSILSAQNLDKQFTEISIGYPILQEQLPENYKYNPLFLTTRFPFFSKNKRKFSFYIEPQLALTFPTSPQKKAVEFGTNLGIQYYFWTSTKSRWNLALGLGPHYTSLETTMQHKGFLFSDNIELGYYRLLGTKIGMQWKTRFRHLSNANLQQPNLGLDNLFIMGGLFWIVD